MTHRCFFFQSLKYMTFQFVSTSASALHTQITQHHGLVLDVVRKNRSNMCLTYCVLYLLCQKSRPFLRKFCVELPTSTAGVYNESTHPGWSRNRGTRIKKTTTTPMAAMMRPIKRPWGCFFGVAFLGYLSSCTQRIHGTIWHIFTYIFLFMVVKVGQDIEKMDPSSQPNRLLLAIPVLAIKESFDEKVGR